MDRDREDIPELETRPETDAAPDDQAPPADDPRDDGGEAVTVEDLDRARAEATDLLARLQRTAADFDNFRKQVPRRIENATRFARRDLVADLLPVIDNFERALEAAQGDVDPARFRQGVQLVHDQFLQALGAHGVEAVGALGKPFDPEQHEAVAHAPHPEVPADHVAEVHQRGYRLGDLTIRPARVTVSSGPAEAGGAAPEGDDEDRPGVDAEA